MSDAGRKDFSSKVSDTFTPESQKSGGDSLKDQASGAYDSAASSLQPESQKSTGQQAQDQGSSYLDSAKETISNTFGGSSDKK